jgi:hypothetical protein
VAEIVKPDPADLKKTFTQISYKGRALVTLAQPKFDFDSCLSQLALLFYMMSLQDEVSRPDQQN